MWNEEAVSNQHSAFSQRNILAVNDVFQILATCSGVPWITAILAILPVPVQHKKCAIG